MVCSHACVAEMALPREIRWLIWGQITLASAVVIISGIVAGFSAALAAAIGGGIGVIANSCAAFRALRVSAKINPVLSFRSLAAGEVLKFALIVVLFALVFSVYREVAVLPLLVGFIATFAMYWVALLKQG